MLLVILLIVFLVPRYLKNTFSRAVSRTQPNVIAFLGDLMDEGHIAPPHEFEKYKRRIATIFDTPDHMMVRIFIFSRFKYLILSICVN